ncbi:MAG: phosphonate ABC transporter, permease protein PhnE [Rhodobacteraceae bacterium]|nr:phosphonate ABC transporter, permease protein PhnE [Paracoccaceae bacterium]
MTITAHMEELAASYPQAINPNRKRLAAWLAGLLTLVGYLFYIWGAFDVSSALDRANTDRASLLALDTYAYKHHVELSLKSGDLMVNLEGNRRNAYETLPEWVVSAGGETRVDMGAGYLAVISLARLQLFKNDVLITDIETTATGPILHSAPQDWMRIAANKIEGRPDIYVRFIVTKSKILLQRYSTGWENFWFDSSSELNGTSIWAAIALTFSEDRLDTAQSNYALVTSEIWGNNEWQHGQIMHAMMITVLMAFCGTLLAAITALPLSFMAANNINPVGLLRFSMKRVFDFLRGVDALIWSLIFIRAFGLGPLSGILALWLTDTGTFGKMFSEAIENADQKQMDGVNSVGAGKVQTTWFGVIPQILPVLISQTLYFLESNTRSATVIGMLGAGGIGLKLADTMRTGQDWENTMYIIFLIIFVVIIMDNISSWLRARLIKGAEKSAL